MVRRLWCTLQIPVLALVDADPHGESAVVNTLPTLFKILNNTINHLTDGQICLTCFMRILLNVTKCSLSSVSLMSRQSMSQMKLVNYKFTPQLNISN